VGWRKVAEDTYQPNSIYLLSSSLPFATFVLFIKIAIIPAVFPGNIFPFLEERNFHNPLPMRAFVFL